MYSCTEESPLIPCPALEVMNPKLAAQFIVANNMEFPQHFPTKYFSCFGSGSEATVMGEGESLLLGNIPQNPLGFSVVPHHSFGP